MLEQSINGANVSNAKNPKSVVRKAYALLDKAEKKVFVRVANKVNSRPKHKLADIMRRWNKSFGGDS